MITTPKSGHTNFNDHTHFGLTNQKVLATACIVLVFQCLASMEETVYHCNISVDEMDCKLLLLFHCEHSEEKESERERDRQKEKETEREQRRIQQFMKGGSFTRLAE